MQQGWIHVLHSCRPGWSDGCESVQQQVKVGELPKWCVCVRVRACVHACMVQTMSMKRVKGNKLVRDEPHWEIQSAVHDGVLRVCARSCSTLHASD